MKKNSVVCVVLLASTLGSACSAAAPAKIKKVSQKSQRREIELVHDAPEHQHKYFLSLSASYQHASGKIPQALESFNRLLENNQSPHSYNGFVHFLFDVGQFKAIADLYERHSATFDKAFEDDIEIRLIIAQSYANLNQDAKAEDMFIKIATKYPDNEQVAYFAALAYLKNNQNDKAEEFINKCLKNPQLKQRHFLFHFLYSKVLIQQHKLPQALEQIEKSLELFPKFDRAWLFKAVVLEQMGKINEAISGYKQFLDLAGRDEMVEKQLAQLLFSQNRFTEARSYLKRSNVNSPEYLFELAIIDFKANRHKKALASLDKAIKLEPKFVKGRLLKAEILLQNKRVSELLAFLRDWIKQDFDDLSVVHTFLLTRKAGVHPAALIRTLQELEKIKPHVNILAALADLHLESKNYKQALEYYQKLLAQTTDNDVKSKVLFQIGYIHFATNQPTLLESTLQQALTCTPVYPSVYNLLAYHYADHNKNLDQALELIEKALAIAPDCYYYLDTKGLVLLKQGKHAQARELFVKALEQSPDDQVIKKHLSMTQEATP